MRSVSVSRAVRRLLLQALLAAGVVSAHAGGPRWVTGTSYFKHPGVPIAWAGGQVRYYTDQGDLSVSVNNAAANALVAAAAAPWNGVPYATVNISAAGTLGEDVNGSDTSAGPAGIVFPADVQSANTAMPLAIIYDADGSITDLMLGQGASNPEACEQNGVSESVDNMTTDGVIAHALLVLNGRCTGSSEQQLQMQYQLERMFGRVLGLDWSQTNDNMFTGSPAPTLAEATDWPIMHPIDILCGPYSYQCLPAPFTLRPDDRAALGRLYPVTHQNLALYPGKQDIWKLSIGISGKVMFADGQPMQGVNVVVRYISPNYNRLVPVELISTVTGVGFRGNAGNPVTGYADAAGNRFDRFGSADPAQEGAFSTLGLEQTLEPGRPWENLLFSVEAINPLYIGEYSVGPYTVNQVTPSGTVAPYFQGVVSNGATYKEVFTAANGALDGHLMLDGTEASPASVPADGFWDEQLTGYGHTGWYGLQVQANRTLTVETLAVDEQGYASNAKAMPVIGIWNGSDAIGSPSDVSAPAFNGAGTGRTSLAASTSVAERLRLAIADQRGDGRPDYAYQARVLYADNIVPAQVGTGGGEVTISGMGFKAGNVVTVGGVRCSVQQLTATQIVALAPPLAALSGATAGAAQDVTISDLATGGATTMQGALAYAANGASVTAQLMVVSGGGQVLGVQGTLAPVVLEVTDGAGHAVPRALVQVYQTVTGPQTCTGRGRCSEPPLLGTANTAETADVNGMVFIDPLQIADRAQAVNIVATAETQGLVRVTLVKQP